MAKVRKTLIDTGEISTAKGRSTVSCTRRDRASLKDTDKKVRARKAKAWRLNHTGRNTPKRAKRRIGKGR